MKEPSKFAALQLQDFYPELEALSVWSSMCPPLVQDLWFPATSPKYAAR